MKTLLSFRFLAGVFLILAGVSSAFAGPPLICHRLEIGDARSLPWNGTAWNLAGNESYDTRNLAQDTLAILDSGAPVIVRMETLRRATLYSRKDSHAARVLFTRLYQRANTAELAGHPDAIAWFDVGYLAEAYQQWFGKEQNPATGLDGYSMVVKALALRNGSDPEMEFAAALITLQGPEQAHREQVQKAMAGAKADPLLARNLSSQFLGDEKQTVSEALARSSTGVEAMNSRAAKFALRFAVVCWLAGSVFVQNRPAEAGLVAHEWGTFTSVAGADGHAVQWAPLAFNNLRFDQNGSVQWADGHFHSKELPSFVETLNFGVFKAGLAARIRMETPVLYFYSSRPLTLSVQVKFAKGLITEWYPHAELPVRDRGLDTAALYQKGSADDGIFWDTVALKPGVAPDLPRDLDDSGNRYYAARETAATPLRVHAAGSEQQEKFLFYRGVSMHTVPVSATFTANGNAHVENSLDDAIPSIIWYERRGDRAGYRISNGLAGAADVNLEPPELTGATDSLAGDLEEILVAQGLYRDEAHAMIETWRDHWFEEGSRLFYIVPQHFVDTILPLSITPAPAQTTRVFVGRMELVSPATKQEVAAALAANDEKTLAKYGRFLSAIIAMVQKSNPRLSQSPSNTPCEVEPAKVSQRR